MSTTAKRDWAASINVWMAVGSKIPKIAVLLKAAKAGKLFAMASTMVLSAIAYGATTNSWVFGVGLVFLLFIHEIGHVIAARRCGVEASAPIFIPFVGAAMFIKKFDSVRNESIVGVGGPLLGTLGALLLLIPMMFSKDPVWHGLFVAGILLNAFNLIPLRPLDGGRMTSICGKWFKVFGLGLLLFASVLIREPVILYIWVLCLQDIKLPLWWKWPTSLGVTVVMAMLMLNGYSSQHYGVDIADTVFALLITLCYYWNEQGIAKGGKDLFVETFVDQDTILLGERFRWAFIWAGMLVVLSGFLFVPQLVLK